MWVCGELYLLIIHIYQEYLFIVLNYVYVGVINYIYCIKCGRPLAHAESQELSECKSQRKTVNYAQIFVKT